MQCSQNHTSGNKRTPSPARGGLGWGHRLCTIPLLLLILVIAGCGGGKKEESATSIPPTATLEPTLPPTPTIAPSPTAVEVSQAEACTALVQAAYEKTNAACEATGRDQACYGNAQVQAEPTTLDFNETGDIVNVTDLQSLRLSSMDTLSQEWGVSLMRLQAGIGTAQDIELLLFGNVELQTAGKTEGGVQAFTFQSGVDDAPCEAAPDSGIMVQTPQGVGEITLLVNEVVIDLGSTAYLQSQPGAEMVVNTIEGQASVTANGQTVVVVAGTRTRIPVNTSGVAAGAPSRPEPYDDTALQPLPVVLLDRPVTIAPAVSTSALGALRETLHFSGEITPANEEAYTFDASAGQNIYVQAVVTEPLCCAEWQLLDANDQVLAGGGFSNTEDYREITLPADGRYQLLFKVLNQEERIPFQGQLGVVLQPQTFNLNLGDTIAPDTPAEGAGRIETIGSKDVYTFTASNYGVYFELLSEIGVSNLAWTLTDHAGNNLLTSVGFGEAWEEERTLTQGETYTLTVDGVNLFTGEYSLKLWEVPPPQETTIPLNELVNGAIEVVGAQDIYTFSVGAGQEIYLDWQEDYCCELFWELIDETGASVISSVVAQDEQRILERGGTYRLVVDGEKMHTQTYAFTVVSAPSPDTFEVSLGDTIAPDLPGTGAGHLEVAGSQDTYIFTAEAGQTIYLIYGEAALENEGQIYLDLVDEDGNQVFANHIFSSGHIEPVTLERGGTYQLIANGYLATTGTYKLTISLDVFGALPLEEGTIRYWATSATASTQWSDTSWNAMQATGEPNTLQCGDIASAWASSSAQGKDTLELHYDQPLVPRRIDIYQTYNPGSIIQVQLLTVSGETVTLPASADPPGNTPCPGIFSLRVSDFSEPVDGIIIHFDQTIGGSWNEIDAVALIGYPTR